MPWLVMIWVAPTLLHRTIVECMGVIYDLLCSCGNGTFPIVNVVSGGMYYGMATCCVDCCNTVHLKQLLDVLKDYDGQ